jgi:hypothetical protein
LLWFNGALTCSGTFLLHPRLAALVRFPFAVPLRCTSNLVISQLSGQEVGGETATRTVPMRRVYSFAMAGSRVSTVVLLLLASLFSPLTPFLNAWASSSQGCRCCDKPGAKYCRRAHRPLPGALPNAPTWSASTTCGSGCPVAGSSIPQTAVLLFTAPAAFCHAPETRKAVLPQTNSGYDFTSDSAWTYQLPPPVVV